MYMPVYMKRMCLPVCMRACTSVGMCVCVYLCKSVSLSVCMYKCLRVCKYVSIHSRYVSMWVCRYFGM